MTDDRSVDSYLYRVFTENFSASDIAEPLISFDDSTAPAATRESMLERAIRVVVVRQDVLVTGFVKLETCLN